MHATDDYLTDTLAWVKSRLGSGSNELVLKEFDSIFSFLLVWGLFEGRLCKDEDENRLSINNLIKLVKSDRCVIDESRVCKIYEIFVSRYFGSAQVQGAFDNLQLEEGQRKFFGDNKITVKEFVKNIMRNPGAVFHEKFAALLMVSYRFRNNLYHGIKRVDKFREYQKYYVEINEFLRLIVDGCPEDWFKEVQN